MKKLTSLLFAFSLLLFTFCAQAASVEVYGADGVLKRSYPRLQLALNNVGEASGTAEFDTVRLLGDVSGDVTLAEGKAAILDLNGYTLTGSGRNSVITIEQGAALTLTDLSAAQTGKVMMPEGAMGITEAGTGGGGVCNRGMFKMAGGTITNCLATGTACIGGGVYNNGTFKMTGGTIANCTAVSGGGVYNHDTFKMAGGTIANCTALSGGGGVNNSDKFTMTGGTISDCEATMGNGGGVSNVASYDKFKMTGGVISGCVGVVGGGVFNGGKFTLTGGVVADCTASARGDGVFSGGSISTFTMTGGAVKDAIFHGDYIGIISISGGLLGEAAVNSKGFSSWLLKDYELIDNLDETTKVDFPKQVRCHFDAEVVSADGKTTGRHETLQAALNAVGAAGATETNTVRLLRHVAGDVVLTSSKAAILDLNGFTLTGGGTNSILTIETSAALTLMDTSEAQTGKVVLPEEAGTGFGGVCNCGTFKMIGGAVKNALLNDGGTIALSAGLLGEEAAKSQGCSEGLGTDYELIDNLDEATKADFPKRVRGKYGVELISADGTTSRYETLQAALDNIVAGRGRAGETNTVRFLRNVEGDVTLTKFKAAILDLNGFTLTGSGTNSVITIELRTVLILTDTSVARTGKVTMSEDTTGSENGGGVYISDSQATFTMTGGAISGCRAVNGGGVYNVSTTTFTMTGGTIADCKAVSADGIYNQGTFTMTGGALANAIHNEGHASISGGLFDNEPGSELLAEGAEVMRNADEATRDDYLWRVESGPAVEVIWANGAPTSRYATLQTALDEVGSNAVAQAEADTVRLLRNALGDVTLAKGKVILDLNGFTLIGGGTNSVIAITADAELTLTDSSAAQTGMVTMPRGAEAKYTFGGGVHNEGTFTLAGGTIAGCAVYGTDPIGLRHVGGGGVYNEGTFTMTGGTIADCVTRTGGDGGGGGVYNYGAQARFTMTGGTVAKCTVIGGGGGGVFNDGAFTMTGGTITDCMTEGGGVENRGTFILAGGAILNCNTGEDKDGFVLHGHGIQNEYAFTMTGGKVENQIYNLYAGHGQATTITISGGLLGDEAKEKIGRSWLAPGMTLVDLGDGWWQVTPSGQTPTCTGGEIAAGEDGEWVVTPDTDATEVEIAGLPTGDSVVVPPTVTKVTGAGDDKIIVKSGTHDITDAFTITDGAIALNPEGVVNGVPVKPTIGGIDGDATEPFVVGEESAAVTVRAIPGLKYELWRAEGIGSGGFIEAALPVGEPVVAEDATVTLTDGEPPKVKAFYKVVVSVP